jgi:hypothetical protein
MKNFDNEQTVPNEEPQVIGLEYLLLPQEGDRVIISKYIGELLLKSKAELVVEYNNQVKIGIVGVRAQSLKIFSIGQVFKKEFGKSPVSFKQNMILGLTGKIELRGETYEYVK